MTVRSIPSAESFTVEFKSDVKRLSDDEIVEAAICFANAVSGTIYIGVEDDGVISGLHKSRPADVTLLAAMISNRTNPPVTAICREVIADGKRICVVEVTKSTPITARSDGLIKRRQLDSHGKPQCVPFLPPEFSSHAGDALQIDMSARPVAASTLDDFDPLQRQRLRAIIARNPRSDKALTALADDELDGALKLTISESGIRRPTLLGLLLIGKTDSLRRLVPSHEVLFQVMQGTRVKVNEASSAALVEIVEWLDLLSKGVNVEEEFNEGLFRIGVARVDSEALREAINNALVHRDYARLGPVRVCWEDERLTISNPGGFVAGVNLNNLLTTEPRPRNPALADAFKRIGLVDRTGRGVDLIFTGMLRFGRPMPDYSESPSDLVKLIISTTPADLAFVRMVLNEEARGAMALPVESLMILTALRVERRTGMQQIAMQLQRSAPQTKAILEKLVEAGLIEAQGGNRNRQYMLSPSVYRALGQRAEYTRQAGFAPLQQAEMVKNYLRDHGSMKRADVANLCRISPDEAGALLQEMVKRGDIVLEGLRRAAIYRLAPFAAPPTSTR
jgi:ATP-dependent DNA helicase RecG